MNRIPKILIVDDEVFILRAIKHLLTRYHLDVLTVTNPEEAISILKTDSIDMILSDQRMPTMDGISLLSKAKESSPKAIRMLMSGYSDVEVFITGINQGIIYYFIAKPWDNDKLVKVIFDALFSRERQEEHDYLSKKLQINNDSYQILSFSKQALRTDYLNLLVLKDTNLSEGMIAEAKTLAIDGTARVFCCLISIKESKSMITDNIKGTSLLTEVIFILNMVPNTIAWDCSGNISIIYQSTLNSNINITDITGNIYQLILKHYPELIIKVGVSRENIGLLGIQKSYHQALTALNALLTEHTKEKISYYQQLGVMKLLSGILDSSLQNEFIHDHLGALITYDQEHGVEFVLSLEEILRCNSLKEAANQLYIHPKTIIFRKKRIESILGISLDDYETRLSLSMAIKLFKTTATYL